MPILSLLIENYDLSDLAHQAFILFLITLLMAKLPAIRVQWGKTRW